MKILIPEWKSFGTEDIIEAFTSLGHEVKTIPFSKKEPHHDEAEENKIIAAIRDFCPDIVFTFNYFPSVSLACKSENMRYFSWIYDSPYVLLYSYTVIYPGNYIFVFDKELYLEFHNSGISTVHYLPLAANTRRLSDMLQNKNGIAAYRSSKWCVQTDISFVGSLYNEKHQFFHRLNHLPPYIKGYLDGIISMQKQVYGINFIQELLTPEIIAELEKSLSMEPDPTGTESPAFLYSQYVINRQITSLERTELLSAIGERFSLDLYTTDENLMLPGCTNHGRVDYYDMAPYIFQDSKINLNITLRSIRSGIPLRAFDILGAGGFLLTNYQSDFADCYTADQDFVFYESKEDLLQKIDYYLKHDDERRAIAGNGFQTTMQNHTYIHRVQEMLSYL